MKNNLLLVMFLILTLPFLVIAQPTLELVGSYPEVNIVSINKIPNGEFMAFGHGCLEDNPDVVNMFITVDGEWTKITETDPVNWPTSYLVGRDAHMFTPQNGILLMTQGNAGYGIPGIYKTETGGLSWNRVFSLERNGGIDGFEQLHFFNDMVGVILVSTYKDQFSSYLLKTEDGGNTWTEKFKGEFRDQYFSKMGIADDGTFFVLATTTKSWMNLSTQVIRFDNFGESFEEVFSEDGERDAKVVQFISNDIGFASYYTEEWSEHDALYKTIDGGVSWVALTPPTDHLNERMKIRKILFLDEMEGFVLGGDFCDNNGCYRGGTLLHTLDGGVSWNTILLRSFVDHNFWDFSFNKATGVGYVVGGNLDSERGKIYKFEYDKFVGNNDFILANLVNVTPNPAPNKFKMNFNGLESTGDLKIFSIEGKEILSKIVQNGSYDFILPNGYYYYHLIASNKVDSGSIIIK